jgi:hypothetical protein
MRAFVWSSLLLGACAPASNQPGWVQDDWAAETLYFRTIGELAPVVDGDVVDDSATGAWGGFEEWRVEDVDGNALCVVRWESDGAEADFDCADDCDRGWDLVCHSGEQQGACGEWFDADTITMSSELDVAYRADEGAVYMRGDEMETWNYQAKGAMVGARLSYDERFAF